MSFLKSMVSENILAVESSTALENIDKNKSMILHRPTSPTLTHFILCYSIPF